METNTDIHNNLLHIRNEMTSGRAEGYSRGYIDWTESEILLNKVASSGKILDVEAIISAVKDKTLSRDTADMLLKAVHSDQSIDSLVPPTTGDRIQRKIRRFSRFIGWNTSYPLSEEQMNHLESTTLPKRD